MRLLLSCLPRGAEGVLSVDFLSVKKPIAKTRAPNSAINISSRSNDETTLDSMIRMMSRATSELGMAPHIIDFIRAGAIRNTKNAIAQNPIITSPSSFSFFAKDPSQYGRIDAMPSTMNAAKVIKVSMPKMKLASALNRLLILPIKPVLNLTW